MLFRIDVKAVHGQFVVFISFLSLMHSLFALELDEKGLVAIVRNDIVFVFKVIKV